MTTDPLFADALGTDGITGTLDDDLQLSADSPAIDSGDNDSIAESTDLDGNARFYDDTGVVDTGNGSVPIVDMGAYERQSNTPPPEIMVTGQEQEIDNGDSSPDTLDDTDFGSLAIGNTLNHTFTISNNGSADLTLAGSPSVTLTNATHFTVTQPTSTTLSSGQSTTFTLTFAPQSTGTFSDTVTIANNDADETPYTFVISGTGALADLNLVKTVTPASVQPGQTITYTLTFSNIGSADADENAVITDTLPLSLTVQKVISSGDVVITRTFSSQTAEVFETSAVSIGAGGIITITAIVTQPLTAGVIITNRATITTTYDTDSANNEAEVGLTINNSAPVLNVISNQTITETETLTFSITASDGNGDTLTYGLSNAESGMILDSSGHFTWTPTSGTKGLYTITVVVTDTHGLTDGTTVLITVKGALPKLVITKTVALSGSNPAVPGDPLTYIIVLANHGQGDADDVTVQDTLPTGVSGSNLDWTGLVTASESLTFTIVATVTDEAGYGAIVLNTATYDHSSGSGSDMVGFTVISDTTAPPDPTLITPVNDSTITNTDSLTFSWSSVTDDQSGLDYYTLQVDSSEDGLSIQASSDSITTTQNSYTPTNALANGDYVWTVTAHDKVGNVSSGGLTATFTISVTTVSTSTTVYLPIVIMGN